MARVRYLNYKPLEKVLHTYLKLVKNFTPLYFCKNVFEEKTIALKFELDFMIRDESFLG